MKWCNKGHEFDELGKKLSNPNNMYLIWGAGTIGINLFRDLTTKINVCGFIDSDENKINKVAEGERIYSPEEALRNYDNAIILIATGWYEEVAKVLNQYQKVENVDYFNMDLFVTVFMMYRYNELVLNKLNFLVTQRCSLKCKQCGVFVPYIQNPMDFPVDFLINELNILFRHVKKVNTLNLYGGDTFMHMQLDELLEKIGEDFHDNIGTVNIFTNAVILPDRKRLDIIKKYDMMIRFTDYSDCVSHLQKKDEMISLLTTEGIRYDCAKFSSWYDVGYPQTSNKIEEKELEEYFNNCFVNMCQMLCENKVYPCATAYFADKINYIFADDSDSISIYDITEENKKIFMEFYLGYSEKGYVQLCKACNGGQNTNQIPIPVAEQLGAEFNKIQKIISGGGKIVFWGCGNTAEIYWEDYEKDGIYPGYWIDNNESKREKGFKGYNVFAPSKLLQEENDFYIIVFANIPSSYKAIEKEALLYTNRVCTADALYYYKHQEELITFIDRIDNEHSKNIFITMLLNRMRGEFNSDEIICQRDYFPTFPFSAYSSDEVYVDLGAFKGDTMEKYMFVKYGIFNKYYAFEPVEENFEALNIRRDRLEREWAIEPGRIICEKKGVGKESGKLELSWDNSVGAGTILNCQKNQEITFVTLDDFFENEKISVIKADIEGMEMDMLAGAKKVIQRDRPLLAICIYHKLSDLINIPNFIYDLDMGYHFDVRCYSDYFAETVLYAW